MSKTRGPTKKAKQFEWSFDPKLKMVRIQNENGLEHSYSVQEIHDILSELQKKFAAKWFPLGNNVEKLWDGTERMGLGRAILERGKGNVLHAQGASYLGVVLEECGYLVWNGEHKGIAWQIVDTDFRHETLADRLACPPEKTRAGRKPGLLDRFGNDVEYKTNSDDTGANGGNL